MHDVTELIYAKASEIEAKATLGGGDTLTGYDYPRAGHIVRPSRLMVQDLMPQAESGSNGISYHQLTTMPAPPAAPIPEGTAKTDAAFVGAPKQAKMRKAAAWQKIAWEFYNDTEVFTGFVRNFLALSLARAIEKIIITEFTGSGAASAAAPADLAKIATAKAAILDAGFQPDGVVVSAADFATLRGVTLGDGPFGARDRSELGKVYFDTVLNMAVVESSAMATGTAIIGAFSGGSMLYRHSGGPNVSVTDSDQDDFVKNLVTVRIESRNAVAIFALPAFQLIA